MSESSRRVLISCVVIAVVVCLCLSLVSILGGIGILFFRNRSLSINLPSKNTNTQESVVLTEAEIEKQMDEIQTQVSQYRGLKPSAPVVRSLLTSDQLRQHVTDDFLKDYSAEDAQNDAISLAAFGLLQPDFDLRNFLLELYSEQIAGFYDQKTKEMYVVQGESFQGSERMTYAHEFTHVLQDQNYDIQNGLNYKDETCKLESERCAAIQALLEGDASLSELIWFQTYATDQDKKDILAKYSDYKSPVYDNAPDFMKEDFLFPYQQGQEFVQTLYNQGGWNAIDQAYKEVPTSTEQILHPEKYPNDQPVSVSFPDLSTSLGSGWEEVDKGVLGEWYTYLVLAHGQDPHSQLSEKTASTASQGWGGDAYAVYYNKDTNQTTMSLKTVWDSQKDADEFIQAFETFSTDRFGQPATQTNGSVTWETADSFTGLYHQGSQTVWIYAPDENTAQSILPQIENP
jgi:hypothetical protein